MSTVQPQDATMYWLSGRTRNDLFLLYCFAESELSTDQLRAIIARRSARIPDLCVRLRPAPRDLAYPTWVPCAFDTGQFVEYRLPQADWAHLEQALGEVLATGVDAAVHPWRLHVFRGITGAPLPSRGESALGEVESGSIPAAAEALAGPSGSVAAHRATGAAPGEVDVSGPPTGPGRASGTTGLTELRRAVDVTADPSGSRAAPRVTVAVLQMSHALADGRRAAELARALFAPPVRGSRRSPAASRDQRENELLAAEPADSSPQVSAARSRRDRADSRERVPDIGTPSGAARHRAGRAAATGREIVRTAAAAAIRFGAAVKTIRVGAAAKAIRFGAAVEAVRLGAAVAGIPVRMARTVVGGIGAFRAQRELAEATAAGELPEAGGGFAASVLNGPGEVGGHAVRMIVCPVAWLRAPGFSVTVLALTAVSIALERYLDQRGEPVDRLGAQVPMALPAPDQVVSRDAGRLRSAAALVRDRVAGAAPRNNYRSLGVELFSGESDPRRRAELIAADLAARRTRASHPLLAAQDRVTAALPAPILRRDVDRYPIDIVPESIAGHTVVSSVHRGPADLTFGAAPVLFTAGFPALGSVMHLTHGVHGLGDTVTISLHADPETMPDLDLYTDVLRSALAEVGGIRPAAD
ncbi:WS/DGAT domain-containing protein [Nocardia cyriacigeorgica]|uniref:WS/DGAT domain-containing protein n=1 Tax=Nocardia cyriacigeorgica TaxID=135487 RepID=UPI0018932018|nr:WS/DGAT domain-containing protein [Nocardia cyriacigeorgica]MBF6438068.1 DUF1298 domain-containing protein [Nocardia cyriacigeorgica]